MKISITEFLQGKIKCPYLIKQDRPDYDGSNKKHNLNDPAERGQYLHAYIANKLDNKRFIYQSSSYNKQAEEMVKWVNECFPEMKFYAEEQVTKEINGATIVGKPDAYAVDDNDLIIIDFKFSKTFYPFYFDQIIFYAGCKTEQYTEINSIHLYIKYPGRDPSYFWFDRNAVLQLYESIVSRVQSFVNLAEKTPCCECERCKDTECLTGYKYAVLKAAEKVAQWTGDTLTDEMKKEVAFDDAVMHKYKIQSALPTQTYVRYDPRYSQRLVEIVKENGLNEDYYIDKKEQVKKDKAEKLLNEGIITQEEYDECTVVSAMAPDPADYCDWEG